MTECCDRMNYACGRCGGVCAFMDACKVHESTITRCSCPPKTGALSMAIANVRALIHANEDGWIIASLYEMYLRLHEMKRDPQMIDA